MDRARSHYRELINKHRRMRRRMKFRQEAFLLAHEIAIAEVIARINEPWELFIKDLK